ncbi:MAG: hypothetical protein IJA24_08805 [Alistipes sp.]|nr:hypothetical protein [Alistipes sp.]
MKKFRLAVLAAVVCTAALLTSCIKEESYEVSTAYLDVTLSTRAASTQQQGDGITDVMLWAFKCESVDANGIPSNVQSEASGWRTVTGLNTFETTGPIHMPLPLCDNGSQNYVIVAVINKGQFGRIIDRTAQQETVDGVTRYPTLALNANTTYSQLINASFDASQQAWWQGYVSDDAKTPTHMPVSHWATVEVSNTNTHPDHCAKVNLDVFRAVAKAQLFMTKASEFNLEVVEAKLSYNQMPVEGVLLSGLTAAALKTYDPTPAWLGTTVPRDEDWGNSSPLKNENGGIFKPEEGDTDNKQNSVTVTCVGSGSYQFVGSTFMHESTKVCEQTSPTFDLGSVTTDKGYYLEIAYEINNGDEIHKLVAIPYAVVRNHDYQIKATVYADGQISVAYEVADWTKREWELTYDAPINSPIQQTPEANAGRPEGKPTMRFTNGTEEGAFVGYFQMTGPEGLTWQPTLTKGVRYALAVYKVLSEDGQLSPDPVPTPIAADEDAWYAIKVIALEPMDTSEGADNTVSLGITYAPKWDESATDFLIINPTQSDGYPYWQATEATDKSEFLLTITQTN